MRHITTATLLLMAAASNCLASEPVTKPAHDQVGRPLMLPNEKEARQAIVTLMGMADVQYQMQVKLGTCIPAVEASHAGQAACTVLVTIGSGSSETQVDFYRSGGIWNAQPSVSQDDLPFPDPAL